MPLTIFTDRERIDQLRRRLAKAERASVVARIQADVNIFAEGAAEDMLLDIAELQDRCAAKAERLGGEPAPKSSRKLRASCQSVPPPDTSKIPGMTIRMRVSPWVTDPASGIQSRILSRADEPVP
jgi:hypothetical protein